MKKIIIFLLLIGIGFGGYYFYKNVYLKNVIPVLEVEDTKASISSYYLYGEYLSLFGTINNVDATYLDVDLVLYNGKFKKYDLEIDRNVNKINFSFGEDINRGMYLDDIDIGEYTMFIRFKYENTDSDSKDKYIYKYYVLDNTTDYKDTTYYTMSKYNKKIVLNSDNDYGTMMFSITSNNDKDIYDIVIDPGHGGVDTGASGYDKNILESDITMNFSIALKEKLEEAGYSVKLTRDADSLLDSEYFNEYNEHGRAVISHEVYAKYLFSIHMNSSSSSSVHGLEFYTPSLIDYTLIEEMVSNVLEYTSIGTSGNKTHRVEQGIYTHNYSDYEIDEAMKRYDDKGYKRYNVTNDANYLYMIRETGGIMTGAYVDDSNPSSVGVNSFYNSNIGSEAYLLELGYLTNREDVNIVINNTNEYVDAIVKAIIDNTYNNISTLEE